VHRRYAVAPGHAIRPTAALPLFACEVVPCSELSAQLGWAEFTSRLVLRPASGSNFSPPPLALRVREGWAHWRHSPACATLERVIELALAQATRPQGVVPDQRAPQLIH